MVEFKQKSKNVFASSKLDLDPIWMEYLDFDFSPFDPKFGDHYKERLRVGVYSRVVALSRLIVNVYCSPESI